MIIVLFLLCGSVVHNLSLSVSLRCLANKRVSPGAMITPLGPPSVPTFFGISGTLGPVQKLYLMFPSKKLSTGVLGNAFPKYGLFSPVLSENKQYLGKTFSNTQVNNFLDGNIL